jgi:signal transduction histidine kinase
MTRRILLATAIVVTITLLVGLGTAIVVRARVQDTAAEELSRQARVTASLIEEDLDGVVFRPGEARTQLARYRATLDRSLERARILGGHDIVEAELSIRNRSVPISPDPVILEGVADDLREGEVATIDVDGTPMLVAAERVDLAAGPLTVAIGRIEPLFPSRQVFWSLLVALLVGAALTVALGVWFAQSLSDRLGNIASAATSVGEGDLAVRADARGSDEISEVAGAFNTMADDLESSRDRERQFLMAVGHDLRTPLTTIRGYAEALDRGEVPEERLPEVAEILHRQTDQLSRLIEDVSRLAAIQTSEFSLEPEEVDVGGLVAESVGAYAPRTEAASIRLTIDREAVGRAWLDPDRLRQVIGNLMDNALRYTPEDGAIEVRVEGGESRVGFTITNSGPPIRDEDIPHVFDRLYVADRYRAERPSGSGLGLAIVRELVEAMGGTVSCTAAAESGTTFAVELDRHTAPTP